MRVVGRYLRRAVFAVVITTACVAACAPPGAAQVDRWGYWENGVTEAWWLSPADFTEETASAAVARWKAIGGVAAGGDTWAGDYFRGGSTHGTYVRWSPQGGFVIAHVNKCAAQAVGVVHGRAEFAPPLVRFIPEFSRGARSPHAHGHDHAAAPAPAELRFVPVEWRGERLLIAEEEMGDFGDFVAGLGKFNDWDGYPLFDSLVFFTRRDVPEAGDAEAGPSFARDARPVVPPGYERFLKRPIRATVTAVGRSHDARDYTDEGPSTSTTYARARLISVTLDVGTDHGAADGMRFRVLEPADGDAVKIVRAGKLTSEALVVRGLDERGRATFYDHETEQERPRSKVRAGWRLTTSLY
jgi:hypothetical protein